MSAFKDLLGDAPYPDHPGWKAPGTSQQAAVRMAPQVTGLRARVLHSLKAGGAGTADEIADRLNVSILSIRPRFSELNRLGLIEETGERRSNDSGAAANVWRAK